MWLALLFVIIMLAGVGLTIASGGIFGIILIVVAVIALGVALVSGGFAASRQSSTTAGPEADDSTPQDTDNAPRAHTETGYAHRGQEHMTG